MSDMIKILGTNIINAGLWKFYLAFGVFILGLLSYAFVKKRDYADKIMILAQIILAVITGILIAIAHLSQLIL